MLVEGKKNIFYYEIIQGVCQGMVDFGVCNGYLKNFFYFGVCDGNENFILWRKWNCLVKLIKLK